MTRSRTRVSTRETVSIYEEDSEAEPHAHAKDSRDQPGEEVVKVTTGRRWWRWRRCCRSCCGSHCSCWYTWLVQNMKKQHDSKQIKWIMLNKYYLLNKCTIQCFYVTFPKWRNLLHCGFASDSHKLAEEIQYRSKIYVVTFYFFTNQLCTENQSSNG